MCVDARVGRRRCAANPHQSSTDGVVLQSGRLGQAIQTALEFHEHGFPGLHVFCIVSRNRLDGDAVINCTLEKRNLYIDLVDGPVILTRYG